MQASVVAVLLLAGAVCGQWANWDAQPGSSQGVDTARQYQSQDGNGQATFGYSHPGQSVVSHRDADGNQVGSYAYIDPEGQEIRVSYIADKQGFRIVSNDEVSAARPIKPVAGGNFLQETPEVAAARAAHMQALNAALANRGSSNDDDWEEPAAPVRQQPQTQRWSAPAQQTQTWSAPVQQQQTWSAPAQQTWSGPVVTNRATSWETPKQVAETPEVAAARAAHMQALSEALANAQASGQDEEEWEEPAAPVRQQPQTQRWSAPAQQTQSWSAPAQQTWSAPVVSNTWVSTNGDTPDVLQAKIDFYKAYEAAAALNGVKSNLPPLNIPQHGGPVGPVADTPEVAAAKAAFFAAFNAAASRSG